MGFFYVEGVFCVIDGVCFEGLEVIKKVLGDILLIIEWFEEYDSFIDVG